MATEIARTMLIHGQANPDGTKRDHCCGCWDIYLGDHADELDVYAECNECGEKRDLSAPLHQAIA